MFYRTFHDYVSGVAKLGIGLGVISLLARWVTGNTILASPESIVKYGVFGGIGYALMQAFALMVMGWFGKKVRNESRENLTIGDYLQQKLHSSGYWLLILILLITSMDFMFVQAMISGKLLQMVFNVPAFMGIFYFITFCILFAGTGGIILVHRFAIFQVVFLFAGAILIPLYFFVQEGVQPVYEGIRLYHPYLLVINNYDGLFFMATGIFIGLGQVFADLATWQRIYTMEEQKIFPTFLISGFVWLAFPMAFSTLFMILIYTGGFDDIQSLFTDLMSRLDTPLILAIFVICCLSATTSTFGAGLHSVISLLVRNVYQALKPSLGEPQKIQMGYKLAILIGLFFLVLTYYFTPSLLGLLFFFGNIHASLIAPLVVIMMSKGKVDNFIPFCTVIGLTAGFGSRMYLGNLYSIWLSAMVSLTFVVVYTAGKMILQRNIAKRI
ncbi:transporter [Ammoniphilus sp. 3BR4]|uniref:sodium:solute symporter family transporter n=1 Tax=Ammoniphilus sp. 3BR4 TaxID=3158265 RepID=UPI003466D8D3